MTTTMHTTRLMTITTRMTITTTTMTTKATHPSTNRTPSRLARRPATAAPSPTSPSRQSPSMRPSTQSRLKTSHALSCRAKVPTGRAGRSLRTSSVKPRSSNWSSTATGKSWSRSAEYRRHSQCCAPRRWNGTWVDSHSASRGYRTRCSFCTGWPRCTCSSLASSCSSRSSTSWTRWPSGWRACGCCTGASSCACTSRPSAASPEMYGFPLRISAGWIRAANSWRTLGPCWIRTNYYTQSSRFCWRSSTTRAPACVTRSCGSRRRETSPIRSCLNRLFSADPSTPATNT